MQSTTILALSVRVVISLLTRTYFQPDEYFQSLEPAHHLVFGYGHLTWEWLAHRPIRSVFFPLLNVPLFWLLKVTGISESGKLGDWLLVATCLFSIITVLTQMQILGPKVIHGLLAACTDIYLIELTRRTIGDIYTSSAVSFYSFLTLTNPDDLLQLLFSLTSFFHALALSRSLSNSLETSLTTVAFSFYPWDASPNSPELIYHRPALSLMTMLYLIHRLDPGCGSVSCLAHFVAWFDLQMLLYGSFYTQTSSGHYVSVVG